MEMLEVLPPICFSFHPVLGSHFAVSEAWKHDGHGKPVYLFFRSRPMRAFRMATVPEFDVERRELLPEDWLAVAEGETSAALKQLEEPWSSMSDAVYFALHQRYKNNAVCIGGQWFKSPNA